MSDYVNAVKFIFELCGNEFTTQLLLFALMYIPVFKKRKLFWVRYPACLAAIIGLQNLNRFGYFPVPAPVNYAIVFAMISATTFICFKTDVLQALFTGVCIYGGQHIVSNLSYALIFMIMHFSRNYELFLYFYVILPVSTAAGLVITYFTTVRTLRRKESIKFNNVLICYFAIAFILVASTLTYYGRNAVIWSLNGSAHLLTIASLFTSSTLLLGFMNIGKRQLEEENKILQELLHKDEQRYEQSKLSNEKIQIKYHDLKKHINHGIIDYESLKEVEPDNEIIKSTFFTGNSALDVILSEKALMCERLGIKFICTADGGAVDFMKPYHLYSLVSNALDNAIESLKDETDEALKEITLNIVRREGTCIIKTVNYVKEKVTMFNGLPLTVKSDKENHGFGAKSMRNVVNGYGGQISFYGEGDSFIMVAEIPIPD